MQAFADSERSRADQLVQASDRIEAAAAKISALETALADSQTKVQHEKENSLELRMKMWRGYNSSVHVIPVPRAGGQGTGTPREV